MAIVTFTPDGVAKANVTQPEFFNQARAALIGAGYSNTTWADRLSYNSASDTVFVDIKRDRLVVTSIKRGFLFSTVKVQRAIELIAI